MERLIFYGSSCDKGSREIQLEYYLVEENVSSQYTDMIRYGIRVIQTVIYPGGGKTVDMKQLNNVFYKREDAEEFMKSIIKKRIVPEGLKRYVENYITTRINEAVYV